MTAVLFILVVILWLAVVVLTSQLNKARSRAHMDKVELEALRRSCRTLDYVLHNLRVENYHLHEHIRMIHSDRTRSLRKSKGDAGPN